MSSPWTHSVALSVLAHGAAVGALAILVSGAPSRAERGEPVRVSALLDPGEEAARLESSETAPPEVEVAEYEDTVVEAALPAETVPDPLPAVAAPEETLAALPALETPFRAAEGPGLSAARARLRSAAPPAPAPALPAPAPPRVTAASAPPPQQPRTARPAGRSGAAPQGRLRALYRPSHYPESARRMGLEGRSRVEVNVDARGRVTSARLVQSAGHPLLDEAALRSAREWRFSPPGSPRRIVLPFLFRLQ